MQFKHIYMLESLKFKSIQDIMPFQRKKHSRPLEKDLYIGKMRNIHQSVCIDGVYFNTEKLIKGDPEKLWWAIHPVENISRESDRVFLDSKLYKQLCKIIKEKHPNSFNTVERSKKLNQAKKELETQIKNSVDGTPEKRFKFLGKKN